MAGVSLSWEKAEAFSVGECCGAAGWSCKTSVGVPLVHPGPEGSAASPDGLPVLMLLSGCGRLRFGLEGKPPKPPTRKRSRWNSRPWAREIKVPRRQDNCKLRICCVDTDMKKGAE